jgi:hypothetical protein
VRRHCCSPWAMALATLQHQRLHLPPQLPSIRRHRLQRCCLLPPPIPPSSTAAADSTPVDATGGEGRIEEASLLLVATTLASCRREKRTGIAREGSMALPLLRCEQGWVQRCSTWEWPPQAKTGPTALSAGSALRAMVARWAAAELLRARR